MAQNEYRPVSWNGETISNAKLNQMANNTQFLFERSPRIRYSAAGVTRDSGLKIISGKAPFQTIEGSNYIYLDIEFGSFFSAGCKPVVTASVESNQDAYVHRSHVVLQGRGGEVDHTGFTAVVANEPYTRQGSGWVHYTATGY